jgi:pimeloyl-ACP methyl ester carboxylesterase
VSTPPFLELPRGVESTRVAGARGDLAALVGTPSGERTGAPVLLVPGFTGSKEDFIAVLEAIAGAGHPVVALDQRGQYESVGDAEPSTYDLKALAEDVLSVAHGLGEPVHLLGHSFGGLVVRAAALAEPGAVRSLTLLDSGPSAIPHPSASNLELIISVLPVMDLETIWVAKRQLEAPNEVEPPPPDIEEFMHQRFVSSHPTCLLRQAEQLLAEEDRVDELAGLGLPVLVAYGPDDDAWPPEVQAAMAARLGAGIAVIDGAGHSPAAQQPAATAEALVAFWAAN